MEAQALFIRRDGVILDVVKNDDAALKWFHRNTSHSYAGATEQGYEIIPAGEPWTPDEAAKIRRQAVYYASGDDFHRSRGCIREGRLGRENCSTCCLLGYEPRGGFGDDYSVKRDGPNVAGWARDYVQAGMSIPSYWHAAFLHALNQDQEPPQYVNRAYADALARDCATFGVLFHRATWHGANPETLTHHQNGGYALRSDSL